MKRRERERFRRYLLRLATEHARKVAHLPRWAREVRPLEREYSPPISVGRLDTLG